VPGSSCGGTQSMQYSIKTGKFRSGKKPHQRGGKRGGHEQCWTTNNVKIFNFKTKKHVETSVDLALTGILWKELEHLRTGNYEI